MNVHAKQKQTHRHRKETFGYKGEKKGEGANQGMGLTDTNYYI